MRSLISRLFFSKPATTRYRKQTTKATSIWRTSSLVNRLFPFLKSFDDAPRGSRMDIRKDQFAVEAVRLLQDIADSHFIAFDFEFSGIAERSRDRATKQTIKERYEETRASVQEYQPLQIGLTIVKHDEINDRYVLEPYNLNISPLPLLRERQFTRKWSMNSGAISFLQRNGFDFGTQMIHGVPYLSVQEEEKARAKMTADAKHEEMDLKPDDQPLVQHVRDSISRWQSQSKEDQEEYLNIPHDQPSEISSELNGYQRRLVHQVVQKEFPSMKTQGMGHFVQITNPSDHQQASLKSLQEQWRDRDLARAVGFRWIIDGIIGKNPLRLPDDYLLPALPQSTSAAEGEVPVKTLLDSLNRKLKERRKVLIGHNCMVDIMFLYKMTVGDLPETLEEFKDKVHDLFPAIIDTKFLSSCFSEKHGRLGLGDVAEDLARDSSVQPVIHTSGEFDRYTKGTYLHEAGYDSYITAIVAIRMAAKLQKDGSSRKKDHDRQQQEVAQAAASSPHEFGLQDGYVTATESLDGTSETSLQPPVQAQPASVPPPPPGHSRVDSTTSTASNASSFRSTDSPTSPIPPSSTKQVINKVESSVSAIRSMFASTSIYDTFSKSETSMPGDQTPTQTAEPESQEEKVQRLLKEGRLMPRWNEEGAFWDFYGNKLQVNGTQEGIMNMVD